MSLEQVIADNTRAQTELAHVIRDFLQQLNVSIKGKPGTATDKPQTEAGNEQPATAGKPNSKPATSTSAASSKPSAPAASETGSGESGDGATPTHTYDEVKALVLDVSKKSRATPQESREQAEALLARFGVQKISQLDAAVYDEVHALATKVLAGEADATASVAETEELE